MFLVIRKDKGSMMMIMITAEIISINKIIKYHNNMQSKETHR